MAMAHRLETLGTVERFIRLGRVTERPLVNWWLYFLLLSWITLGIYPLIVFYQRIARRDRHLERKRHLYRAILNCTKEIAGVRGIDVHHQLEDIEAKLKEAEGTLLKPKGAVLWLVLSILTLGLGALYVFYFLTTDWLRLLRFEQELLEELSKVWIRLGIIKYPIKVDHVLSERNYWLYLILSILTLGVWALYWDYVVHTEPDRYFPESHHWESTLLDALRAVDISSTAA